jgi:hypothetical protein
MPAAARLVGDEGGIVSEGGGPEGEETEIEACAEAEPPDPVQVMEYVVERRGVTTADPDILLPVEKLVPEQEEALVELQVRVADCPETREEREEEREAEGAGLEAGGTGAGDPVVRGVIANFK